jgi:hypothetical protein
MSYRKITVNDIEYEFTIGRSHFKVKGVGNGKNEEIGDVVDFYDEDEDDNVYSVTVTPAHIAGYIKRKVK